MRNGGVGDDAARARQGKPMMKKKMARDDMKYSGKGRWGALIRERPRFTGAGIFSIPSFNSTREWAHCQVTYLGRFTPFDLYTIQTTQNDLMIAEITRSRAMTCQ